MRFVSLSRQPAVLIGFAALAWAMLSNVAWAQLLHTDRCDPVDSGTIEIAGLQVRHFADVDEPVLRRINDQISVRCYREARGAIETYAAEHPDDHRVDFLRARLQWISNDRDGAEVLMRRTLRSHPDFDSARVLLASIAADKGEFDKVRELLQPLQEHRPLDLWAFINQKRMDLSETLDEGAIAAFVEIAEHPRLPGSARETAIGHLQMISLPANDRERLLRAQLGFESATPAPLKRIQLAGFLAGEGRRDEALDLLESSLHQGEAPTALRLMLAELYLSSAEGLSANETTRSDLIAKALEVSGGNPMLLRQHVAQRRHLGHLMSLLVSSEIGVPHAEESLAMLCTTSDALNPDAMEALLAAGGDPNATCRSRPLLNRVLLGDGRFAEPKRAIAEALIRHGVTISEAQLDTCADPSNGPFCGEALLPMLQAAAGVQP